MNGCRAVLLERCLFRDRLNVSTAQVVPVFFFLSWKWQKRRRHKTALKVAYHRYATNLHNRSFSGKSQPEEINLLVCLYFLNL